MRYTNLFAMLAFIFPVFALAQVSAIISDAVQIQESESGRVKFTYDIEVGSELVLRTECFGDARFFVEQTGKVIACDESYTVPNPGEGGRLEIIPYDIPEDMTVRHVLLKNGTEEIADNTVSLKKLSPLPLFTQVSLRQSDPTKPVIDVLWETLEKSNMSLYLECDSEGLVLQDKKKNTYGCNEKIAIRENKDKGDMQFIASGYSTAEGLLFSFVAERDGAVSARKNLSFTFEKTTGTDGDISLDEQRVLDRLWAQVQTLLNVIAGLFR